MRPPHRGVRPREAMPGDGSRGSDVLSGLGRRCAPMAVPILRSLTLWSHVNGRKTWFARRPHRGTPGVMQRSAAGSPGRGLPQGCPSWGRRLEIRRRTVRGGLRQGREASGQWTGSRRTLSIHISPTSAPLIRKSRAREVASASVRKIRSTLTQRPMVVRQSSWQPS